MIFPKFGHPNLGSKQGPGLIDVTGGMLKNGNRCENGNRCAAATTAMKIAEHTASSGLIDVTGGMLCYRYYGV